MNTSEFPIYSLNREEKREHLLTLLGRDYCEWIQDGIVKQTMQGLNLAWHYFPHQWSIPCGNMTTPMDVFSRHLEDALVRRRALGACESPSDLRKALRGYSGAQGVSNFRPTAAAAIYDRYLPEDGGAVWDMSAGFGGRLLGALASSKVTRYIGTDPATMTMDGLREMRDELLPLVLDMGYEAPEVALHHIGSEDFIPEPESLSMCFTSTPYGSHERYSDEPTQSYLRFPTNEEWLDGYMRMTLDNCRAGLKTDGFLAVNIAGVPSYPTLHQDFVALAVATGWHLVETLQLVLSRMPGTGKQTASHKYEPVFVFQRT